MIPALRLTFSLVLSLLLWLPTVPAALAAHEEPHLIAARYLVALVVSRIGVGLVFRVVLAYTPDEPEATDDEATDDEASADDEEPHGRRREDVIGDDDDRSEETLLDEALDEVADTNALVS